MNGRLKELRKTLGLKQRELAQKLGCSVSNVGTWEAGIQDIPKTRVYQICKEFNVNRPWFETGEGEMFEPEEKIMDVREAQRAFVYAMMRGMSEEQLDVIYDAIQHEKQALAEAESKKIVTEQD